MSNMNDKKNKQIKNNTDNNNFYGLNTHEINQRKKDFKVNIITKKVEKTVFSIIASNLFSFLNLLVFLVACFIIHLHKYEQLFFLFTNSFNLLIGILQEVKAKYTLDKISLLMSNVSQVMRNGQLVDINSSEIVMDDLLYLETGNQILVDAKVKDGMLEVDESLLTGESNLVPKKKGDFLFSGSYVFSGQAYAEVTEIGDNTYIQKISREAKKYRKIETPLMKNLSFLVRSILIIIIPMSLLLYSFYIGIPDQSKYLLGLFGMIIGMMPTGIFLLVSVALTVGCVKLAQKKAYVQDFFAIEMLSKINVLCLDKTGTITDGNMKVKKIIDLNANHKLPLKKIINKIVTMQKNTNFTNDALKSFFRTSDNQFDEEIINTQPFSSLTKYSVIEFSKLGTFFLGSPEFILQKDFNNIRDEVEKKTKLGYRVILLARNNFSLQANQKDKNIPKEALMLIIIEENIKKDIFDTIDYFQKNDVVVKIISGDNHLTVANIANSLKLDKEVKAISLEKLDDSQVEEAALKYNVFGRTSPHQKKILIESLKKNNYKVAMTGDGVNDVLAFKVADISIAMGSGSQVTRNLANVVLMDSKFSVMPDVVAEGRRVVNNLEKISALFLTKTMFSFFIGISVILQNLFSKEKFLFPIDPLQLNLLDVFSIGIPSFFLSLESNNKIIKYDHFFIKVFKKILPYSLCITLNYLFLLHFLELPPNTITNLLVVIIAFILFILLFQICLPWNKWKKILFVMMLILFSFSFYIFINANFIEFDIYGVRDFIKSIKIVQLCLLNLLTLGFYLFFHKYIIKFYNYKKCKINKNI